MAKSNGGQTNVTQIHRRGSSQEEDDSVLVFPSIQTSPQELGNATEVPSSPTHETSTNTNVNGHLAPPISPPRHRVSSTPLTENGSQTYLDPPSAGPYRTTFAAPRPPSWHGAFPPNVVSHRHQAPAMRQSLSLPSNSHSRTRSVSGPFSPISPSPLSVSFQSHKTDLSKFPTSYTAPELGAKENGISPSPSLSSQAHSRRHSRVHSRNLSVFFPRPGSLPSTAIAEDGTQDVTFNSIQPEGVPMPSASPGPGQRSFREGFTFGVRPPSTTSSHPMPPMAPSVSNGPSRRGHHHKHSLSHNFFSFLEPGTNAQDPPEQLRTSPAPVPVSPWMPISPFPQSPSIEKNGVLLDEHLHQHVERTKSPTGRVRHVPRIAAEAVGIALGQFLLGVWLWISGQQVGSLSCTGLGYWVIFDAFGVASGHILPGYLAKPSMRMEVRRPFG